MIHINLLIPIINLFSVCVFGDLQRQENQLRSIPIKQSIQTTPLFLFFVCYPNTSRVAMEKRIKSELQTKCLATKRRYYRNPSIHIIVLLCLFMISTCCYLSFPVCVYSRNSFSWQSTRFANSIQCLNGIDSYLNLYLVCFDVFLVYLCVCVLILCRTERNSIILKKVYKTTVRH